MSQYVMRFLIGLCVVWVTLFFGGAQAAGWTATGAMPEAKKSHTSTLLPNGKVLVIGGYDDGYYTNTGIFASATLYDPSTGTWTATSDMPVARYGHTTTLLPNGKVLIAGGADSYSTRLASTILYDPATGMWATTGNMTRARFGHTATLLPSGKVLVTAGASDGVNSAELYDPATGTWAATGVMPSSPYAFAYPAATLLTNGKVLVIGGTTGGVTYPSSAVLYDPTTNKWSVTNAMPVAPDRCTATLLPNGKVFVAGGSIAGGNEGGTGTFLYDPATNNWAAAAAMPEGRFLHTATLLTNGKVLVTGGFNYNNIDQVGSALSSTTLYDPLTDTWSTTAAMTSARSEHAATLLPNGKVLVSGGDVDAIDPRSHYHAQTATAELYTPDIGTAKDPDFVVTAIALNPTGPLVNTAFTATVTVKNQGKTAGDGGKLLVWINKATAPLCGAMGNQAQAIGSLAAGASTTLTFTGLKSSKTGTLTFLAFADGQCDTLEKTETNNQKTLSYRVRSTQADFAVSAISLNPVSPAANKAFTASVTVTNNGLAASNAGYLDVWLDQAAAQGCGAEGDAWAGVGNLAAGASKTVNLKLVAGVAGTKTLRAFADSWCQTTEPAESNNQAIKNYVVQ